MANNMKSRKFMCRNCGKIVTIEVSDYEMTAIRMYRAYKLLETKTEEECNILLTGVCLKCNREGM